MPQAELFDRAAQCDRLMTSASDSVTRNAFKILRDLWITLANESLLMTHELLAEEVAALEKIQASLERLAGQQ
jgi:uncharacterized protein with PhoU and TrkA domain